MGMPNARFTYVPHPVSNKPAEECRSYLEGNDPLTGKPIVEEIVAALTVPAAHKRQGGALTSARPWSRGRSWLHLEQRVSDAGQGRVTELGQEGMRGAC